nr:CoA ester lyase [Desulfobacterales bacterium]
MSFRLLRSLLFVPGNRADRIDKAVGLGADAVIIDLEDAVPLKEKDSARAIVREKLAEYRYSTLLVRTNSIESRIIYDDLNEVVTPDLAGIMVPKVEDAEHIFEVNRLLSKIEEEAGILPGTIRVFPLIESARGVQHIHEIVSAKTEPRRIHTVAFGAADYTLDLGIEISREGYELNYPRAVIPIACRAAGIEPPLDTPYMINFKDKEGLIADARRARKLGFQGKLVIHPDQIGPCNRVFSPTKDEIEFAKRVIRAFEEAEARGDAALQVDGKFVDYAVAKKAKRILALATAIKMV